MFSSCSAESPGFGRSLLDPSVLFITFDRDAKPFSASDSRGMYLAFGCAESSVCLALAAESESVVILLLWMACRTSDLPRRMFL
jgi:hypothetical protein